MKLSKRPECGPMRFKGDWAGVFIRGDDAFGFARALEAVLEKSTASPLHKVQVRSFAKLLSSSDERGELSELQEMRSFEECLAEESKVETDP